MTTLVLELMDQDREAILTLELSSLVWGIPNEAQSRVLSANREAMKDNFMHKHAVFVF